MVNTIRGKLVIIATKNKKDNGLRVSFPTKKGGMSKPTFIQAGQLHPDLANRPASELNGQNVDLELEGGQPRRIRPVGAEWVAQKSQQAAAKNLPKRNRDESSRQPKRENRRRQNTIRNLPGEFHNPYNFVPALPRDHLPKFDPKNPRRELNDAPPVGHGRYLLDYWSGRISVKLTTVTPLLIPDAAEMTDNDGHKTYPIRLGADGKPYLPPTSIKGMLRSAYEAVTNSRLSIFQGHNDRLFYRMGASEGLSLVPARIENGQIHLMLGTTPGMPTWNAQNQRWQIPQKTMYAAWLPCYRSNQHHNLGYQGMRHGHHVKAWLELYQKTNSRGAVIFKYWKVREIVPFAQNLGNEPQPGRRYGSHSPVAGQNMIQVDGYVCITGQNIEKKHDERIFFQYPTNSVQHHESCEHLKDDWKYLIENYQKIHEGAERGDGLEWSRHVVEGDSELELSDGTRTLCYAYVEKVNGGYQVKCIYPVMISRAIHDLAPEELLSGGDLDSHKLKPATNVEDLSPADRVFGWVNQNGNGSYKGQLRIAAVQCHSNNAIEYLDQLEIWKETGGMPLAILGEPKPEQARFYAAKTPYGEPLDKGQPKSEGYKQGRGLRGRKVYPHHQLPTDYWKAQTDELQIGDLYREYFHPAKDQTTQNRTIKSWVKPNTEFRFEIHITNLSSVELGALLWLLKLSKNHSKYYHRLGGGKPLGFGSVEIDIIDTDLRTGEQWKDFYSSLIFKPKPNQEMLKDCIRDFEQSLELAYRSKTPEFLQAFVKAAQGFQKPIHYPRPNRKPDPSVESFKWFVENENERRGEKVSLPNIIHDRGLPYQPTH